MSIARRLHQKNLESVVNAYTECGILCVLFNPCNKPSRCVNIPHNIEETGAEC